MYSNPVIKKPEQHYGRGSVIFIIKLGANFTPYSSLCIIDFEPVFVF